MVLQSYGVNVSNARLRAIADQLQGTSGYNDGIALDYLQQIGQEAGLRTEGIKLPDGHYRQWTMGDIIQEIRRGNPVITLVHYASLPFHASSLSKSDHYIVIVGVTSQGFVINDPAFTGTEGYHLLLRPDQLLAAWKAASIQGQAVAFLPPQGVAGLTPLGSNVAIRSNVLGSEPATAPNPPQPSPAPQSPVSEAPSNESPVASTQPGTSVISSLGPPPNPTFAAWAIRLGKWQHGASTASPSPEASNSPATGSPNTDAAIPGNTLVLADRASTTNALPAMVILGLIGALALAIVKAPTQRG